MTDRRGDEGYAVTPVRIGGSSARGSRRRRIGMVVVLFVAIGIVATAWIGPRLAERPNFNVAFFATPVPSPTATPTPAPTVPFGPTPLPAVTRPDDRSISGQIAIWTDTFRVVNLESGSLSNGTAAMPGTDAIQPAPDGVGWTCVCLSERPTPDNGVERDVQVVRLDANGGELGRKTVATLRGQSDPDRGSSGVQTDIEAAPDGRSALLVAGERTGTVWSYTARRIDLVAGSIGPPTSLGRRNVPPAAASPAPSASQLPGATPLQVYTDVYGPVVRRSPDGRLAFVWSTIQQYTDNATLSIESFGWRVELGADGAVDAVGPAKDLATLPPYCNGTAFLRDDAFVATCANYDNPTGRSSWQLVRLDRDAHEVLRMELPNTDNWYSEPLFDRANDVVWLWDSTAQNIVRVDLDRPGSTTKHFDPLLEGAAGSQALPGVAPVWVRPTSTVGRYATTEMTGAPDGSRIYLVGYGQPGSTDGGNPKSLGVFVVDPATLALVGHWTPAAQYVSVQPILGGTTIAAIGAPGVDANGQNAPWQSSLTLHDAVDGRILVRFGQLGEGWYPYIVGP
jgi:hypothetical protein